MICRAEWLPAASSQTPSVAFGEEESFEISEITTLAFEKIMAIIGRIECEMEAYEEFVNRLGHICSDCEENYEKNGEVEPMLHYEDKDQLQVLQLIVDRFPDGADYWAFAEEKIMPIIQAQLAEFQDQRSALMTSENILSIGIAQQYLGHVPKENLKMAIAEGKKNIQPDGPGGFFPS